MSTRKRAARKMTEAEEDALTEVLARASINRAATSHRFRGALASGLPYTQERFQPGDVWAQLEGTAKDEYRANARAGLRAVLKAMAAKPKRPASGKRRVVSRSPKENR